jgi:hypothetical protein
MKEQIRESLIKSRIALTKSIQIEDYLIASCYNTIAANFDELSEFSFLLSKGLVYANKTNNSELKNWLYNNLGNIYCFDKKEYKKRDSQKSHLITAKNWRFG